LSQDQGLMRHENVSQITRFKIAVDSRNRRFYSVLWRVSRRGKAPAFPSFWGSPVSITTL